MKTIAIDPGNEKSAYLLWDGKRIHDFGIVENTKLKKFISDQFDVVVIEMVACYGMPVGKSIFDTCLFIGQIQQLCESINVFCKLAYRKDVKMYFCQSMKAKDSNIRQALIDRFGDKGTKNNQGLTYGLSKDCWSAFAIAVYWFDTFAPESFDKNIVETIDDVIKLIS